jgi:hypothetical protein
VISNISLSVMAWASALRSSIVEAMTEDGGQGILEYVILVGFVAIAAYVGFVAFLGNPGDVNVFGDFAEKLKGCLTFDDATCKV